MKSRTHNIVIAVMSAILIACGSVLLGGPAHAAANSVYFAPGSGTYKVGDSITLAVHEDSGTSPTQTEQIGLSYPQNLLQYVSTDATNSAFGLDTGLGKAGNGHVEIIRGTLTPVTNDQLVADVNFKVLASGTATVSFDPICQGNDVNNCTTVLDANSKNVVTSIASGVFTLQTPAPATCPTGQTGTPPNCVTPTTTTAPSTTTNTSNGSTTTPTATTTAATTAATAATTTPTADPSDLPNTGAGNVIVPAVVVSLLGYAGYLLRLKRHAA